MQISAVQVASSSKRKREAGGKIVGLLELPGFGGEWQTCLKFRILQYVIKAVYIRDP